MSIKLDTQRMLTRSRIGPRRPSLFAGEMNHSRLLWAGLAVVVAILIVTQALGPFPGWGMSGAGAVADEPSPVQAAGLPEPAVTRFHNDGPVSISGGGSIHLIK